MTTQAITKVTLLGPAPAGGSYTSTTDDPTVERLLSEGWTLHHTWPIRPYESFLTAAWSTVWNRDNQSWFTPEAVAQRAFKQQSCIWHACNSIVLEHLDEIGYGHCTICHGRTAPNQNNLHALCKARLDRGLPTPQLDSSPTCSCKTCDDKRSLT